MVPVVGIEFESTRIKAVFLLVLSAVSVLTASGADDSDLARMFVRAKVRGALRAVAIGGSITQDGKGWVGDWLAGRLPGCRTVMFNEGMSATGSSLGVFRLERDVIAAEPDLVLAEFVPNDSSLSDEQAILYLESIVVRLKSLPRPPAIVFLGAASRDHTTQARHRRVAGRYGIPFVDLQRAADEEVAARGGDWFELFKDNVHPNAKGHAVYAAAIAAALEPFVDAADTGDFPADRTLPPKLSAGDLLLDARMSSLTHAGCGGWSPECSVGKWWDKFLNGVLVSPRTGGSRCVIPFRGTAVGLLYAMDPSNGVCYLSVDGAEPVEVNTGARFGYQNVNLSCSLAPGEHTLTVYVPEEEHRPVKLAYLLTAGADRPPEHEAKPRSYDGRISVRPVAAADLEWSRAEGDGWVRNTGATGRLEFADLAPGEKLERAFVRTAVESAEPRRAVLGVKVDYFGCVRLNGRKVYEFLPGHSVRERLFVPLDLVRGHNEIVVEVRPGSKGHFCELFWLEEEK